MQKIPFLSLLIVLFLNTATSQTQLRAGMMFSSSAYSTFSEELPFAMSNSLAINIALVTPKTYHNILYGFNHSLTLINGYFVDNKRDIYVVYSKKLYSNKHYVSLGTEKLIAKHEGLMCFLFLEIGTDFHANVPVTMGMVVSLQTNLMQKPKKTLL